MSGSFVVPFSPPALFASYPLPTHTIPPPFPIRMRVAFCSRRVPSPTSPMTLATRRSIVLRAVRQHAHIRYAGFARMCIEYAAASIQEQRPIDMLEFHLLLARN